MPAKKAPGSAQPKPIDDAHPTQAELRRLPLSGDQLGRLSAALEGAFTLDELRQLLRTELGSEVSITLDSVVPVPGRTLHDICYDLVLWGLHDTRVGLQGLLAAAIQINPGNPLLVELQQAWAGVTFTAPACPYPGMKPFTAAESGQFYGRDAEITQALEHLRRYRVLAIIGPSGCGKSSLLAAGILPALETSHYFVDKPWVMRTLRPGAAPFDRLVETLELPAAVLEPAPVDAGQPIPGLATDRRLLLVVDQYEELFTLAAGDQRTRFEQALLRLANAPDFYLILAARADFYANLMSSALWPQIKDHLLPIPPPRGDALRQAIALPARDVGVLLEPELVERLLADVGDEPGVLPFVQETLVMLWRHAGSLTIGLAAYTDLVGDKSGRSGLEVALAAHADYVYAEVLENDAERAMARRILLRLIQFGEGRADTRRQQTVDELHNGIGSSEVFDKVLAALTANRLLTLSDEARRVDLSHEALIRGWPQFATWIEQRRAAELTRRRLEAKAVERQRLRVGDATGGLLDVVELAEAEAWIKSADATELGVSDDLAALAADSRQAIDAAILEKQRAVTMRWRAMVLALALAASLFLTMGAVYLFNDASTARNAEAKARETAQANEQQAISARDAEAKAKATAQANEQQVRAAKLVYESQSAPANVPAQSLLLATEAYTVMATSGLELPYVEQALRDALNRPLGRPIATNPSGVQSVAVDPRGQWLATGGADGTVSVWSLLDPALEPTAVDIEPNGSINVMTFDATGRWLAVGDANRNLTLIDEQRGYGVTAKARANLGGVRRVVFSPDGRWLATASSEAGIQGEMTYHDLLLWDLSTLALDPPTLVTPTLLSEAMVEALAFSVDGKALSAASQSGEVLTWPLTNTTVASDGAQVLQDFAQAVFSPTSGRMAGISAEGSLQVRSMDAPEEVSIDLELPAEAQRLALSPDGRWVAAATVDDSMTLWNLADPEAPATIDAAGGVLRLLFSPDNQWLAALTRDNAVLLQDLRRPAAAGVRLAGHEGTIEDVSFSTDGKALITASADGTVRMWPLPSSISEPIVLPAQGGQANVVAIDPNWRWAAASSADGLELWNLAHPDQAPILLTGYAGTIQAVTFSADGRRLAAVAASPDEAVALYLWDLHNPRRAPAMLATPDIYINNLAFSEDGKWLAAGGSDGRVLLWDMAHKAPGAAQQLVDAYAPAGAASPPPTNVVAFSPNGRWLAAGTGDDALLWDLQDLGRPPARAAHDGWVLALAFSPDGRWLASGSQGRVIRLWDLAQPQGDQRTLLGHTGAINALAFSNDGTRLASASSDNTARVWPISAQTSGDPARDATVFSGYAGDVELVRFDHNASHLITTAADNTVRLWNLDTPDQQPVLLRGHTGPVVAAALSPDDRRLATGSIDGTIRIWTLPRAELAELACRMAGRNLTQSEWEQYVAGAGKTVYQKTCRAWSAHPTALAPLLAAGSQLAEEGQLAAAAAKFAAAVGIEPSLDLDPATHVEAVYAQSQADQLVQQAQARAEAQDIAGAEQLFARARQFNPELRFEPKQEAEHYARLLPGAGVKAKLWKPGTTLRVRFLGGDPILWQRVEELVQEWSRHANIYFQFGDFPNAEIRIAFESMGSWSFIGTDALNVAQDLPTMNLGLGPDSSDQIIKTHVLHEFGHALGLIHEYQQPNADVPWDTQATYDTYARVGWTKAVVDANLFNRYTPDQMAIVKDFDPASIMIYAVPNRFTLGDYSISAPTDLSVLDKESISKLYPFNTR